MGNIETKISDDLRSLLVGLQERPDQRPYLARFATGCLDEIIGHLGLQRTGMLPPIPESWKAGTMVENCYRDPAWSIETDRLAGDVLLHIRDVRFGWLHFIITKSIAAELAAQLTAIAAAPAPLAAGNA